MRLELWRRLSFFAAVLEILVARVERVFSKEAAEVSPFQGQKETMKLMKNCRGSP